MSKGRYSNSQDGRERSRPSGPARGRAGRVIPDARPEPFRPNAERSYILFYKPFGVLTQFTVDPNSDKRTLAEFKFPKNVYPVGRLDYDSEGLLVLSDDPRLNQRLLEPRYGHDRKYLVQVENVPTDEKLHELREGVLVAGELSAAANADLLEFEPVLPERPVAIRVRKSIPTAWILLTLREGKNRQVRKMTAYVGCPTLRLLRVAVGSLDLFELGLQPGQWIRLSEEQVMKLFKPSGYTTGMPPKN